MERYNAELGYWLAEPYWGKGIMTQMLVLAIRSYFSHTDVIRVYANVYAGNMPSMRVLEKIGDLLVKTGAETPQKQENATL